MKERMYKMILEADDVYKEYRIGTSKKDVMNRYSGNGDYILVEDVTNDFPINLNNLREVLSKGFGKIIVNSIVDLVQKNYANVEE